MRCATRHSIVIVVGGVAGRVTRDRLCHAQPFAASGMAVLSFAAAAIAAFVSERAHAGIRSRIHQRAMVGVSRLRSASGFAAALAHVINQPLAAIGKLVRVATTGSQRMGGRSLNRSIIESIESDGGRLRIERGMNGAVVCFMLPIADLNSEGRA